MQDEILWILQGFFHDYPAWSGENKSWAELGIYATAEELKTEYEKHIDKTGIIRSGYHKYRMIKRTCRDEIIN